MINLKNIGQKRQRKMSTRAGLNLDPDLDLHGKPARAAVGIIKKIAFPGKSLLQVTPPWQEYVF
jgi:hypothetical protein